MTRVESNIDLFSASDIRVMTEAPRECRDENKITRRTTRQVPLFQDFNPECNDFGASESSKHQRTTSINYVHLHRVPVQTLEAVCEASFPLDQRVRE